jgi:hypothetical protein
MAATHEDAVLLVQLLRLDAEMGLDDAMSDLFQPTFDVEDVTTDNPSVRKVLFFGEAVGAMVKHNLIDADLVGDVYWFDGLWGRVSAHALAAREMENEPSLYENFEALVSK